MEKTEKRLGIDDTVQYRDLKDLSRITSALNHVGYGYLVDFGSRTVHITKAPGEEEEECSKVTRK
ncbi:MAG: hypothetical protein Q4A04_09965 [Eubacteriales bacterium]|nr:hypothetical protein [Eubacteriales bacterium]